MTNEIYKPPQSMNESASGSKKINRSWFLRVIFSLLWFLPIFILVVSLVGMAIGLGLNSGASNFSDGYNAGAQAGQAFGAKYGIYIKVSTILAWFLLCVFGVLPGTSKYKKIKS